MKTANNNFEFLVEYITAKVVEWMIKDYGLGLEKRWFSSITPRLLKSSANALRIST